MVIGGFLLCDLLMTIQTWFMGYWAEQYDIYPPEQVNITLLVSAPIDANFFTNNRFSFASYLVIYGLILLAMVISYTTASGVYVFGSLRASRTIHRKLIESVLGTTLR